MSPLPPHFKILVIEDDSVSVMAMQRALRKLGIDNEVRVCRDGIEALEYLAEETRGSTPVDPHLITLDLNMPRMGGQEFLDAIRADPALDDLQVLVCTGADIPAGVRAAHSPHVAGYLAKDRPLESLEQAIGALMRHPPVPALPPRPAAPPT